MRTPLTQEIQSVIIAVRDYKKFLQSYHVFLLKEEQYDCEAGAESFYKSLQLPAGMNTSKACFNAVMSYPIDTTVETEMEDLPNKFEFGY